MLNATPI
jgi:hypothetical protein